jgi:argininosuccinate lyase
MLANEGIISGEEASKILKSLLSVETQATHNPLLSIYMNTEARVIEKAGEAGGKMHIGRSRNDLGATTQRMYVRKMILDLSRDLIELWTALLEKSEEHIETVMIGYTHWQQAQPITLGHYFLAHADHCERSLSRLHCAHQFTNLNTLGAAALAGTGWPINRQMTTQLLGFDGILENTLDCVASRDFLVDVACTIAILMTNLSRLAEDLEMWSTQEFALIELDDAYANTSSIMPQKRNPGTLETVKAHTASAIGGLTSVTSSLKNVSYTNTGDVREAVFTLRRLSNEALLSLRIMKGAVSTLQADKALMLKRATDSYGMMTELADMIVRERNLSFRLAHEIVSAVVATAVQRGLTSNNISSTILDDAANTVLGKPLNLPQGKVQTALNPLENVKARKTMGGPAPKEVKRMLKGRWERVAVESKRCDDKRAKLSTSINHLNTKIERLMASRH